MSVGDTLKQLGVSIASFAPTLASMLGGPLAGTAVAALEGALGLKQGAGADAITQVIQNGAMTPDQLSAVRAADQKHAEVMAQQSIDLAKLNADHEEAFAKDDASDTADARAREIALKDSTPKILAYIVTVGFFGMLYLMYRGKPAEGGDTLLVMVGSLGTAWSLIMGYYFGSSKSSAVKDQTIASITNK